MNSRRRRKIPLEELTQKASDSCFVAMEFSRKFDHLFDEIYAPTIQNSGLTAIRSDLVLSAAGNVVEEIIKIIQLVRLVIVDITGLNPNVLIELGIAQALRRPIIVLTQDTSVPFDIQPKRVIHYNLSASGRRQVKADLQTTIRTSIYPTEDGLRRMFPLESGSKMLVLHGSASKQHIESVHPPIDPAYEKRLFRFSSQTTGMWDISVALQRVALSKGINSFRMDAADGNRCTPDVLESGNLICLGGPGANPVFGVLAAKAIDRFSNSPSIDKFDLPDGRSRFRVTRGQTIFPADQDAKLEGGVDFGLVARFRNPFAPASFAWIVAGVRAFGTEGAISALTTPFHINKIFELIGGEIPDDFWSLIKVTFDPATVTIANVEIEHAERLVMR